MTTKETVIQWIQDLPDDCTMEDILYRLYFREKVEAGLKAAATEDLVPHDEVKRRMSEWLASHGQPQQ